MVESPPDGVERLQAPDRGAELNLLDLGQGRHLSPAGGPAAPTTGVV